MKTQLYPTPTPLDVPFTRSRCAQDAFNIDCPTLNLDAHLRLESSDWILDVFTSGNQNANDAHLDSVSLGATWTDAQVSDELRRIAGLVSGNEVTL